MSDQPSTGRVVRFGVFEADFTTGELRKSGVRVKLEQQPFQVLRVLLQRPGELVTREELREEVWSDHTFVDFDQSLNTAIRKLRDALGDSATHPRFIETLPRRGYRFVGTVDGPRSSEAGSQTALPEPTGRFGLPALLGAFGLGAVLFAVPAYLIVSEGTPPSPVNYRIRQVTFDPGLTFQPALSPNGDLLAYASDRAGEGSLDIWVRQLGSTGEPIRLTDHPADDQEPSFSPDGKTIVFRSERDGAGVYLVPAFGGNTRLLVKNGRRPRFSPDGSLVCYWAGPEGSFMGELGIIPAVGGEPQRLKTALKTGLYPIWTPDGENLMFLGYERDMEDWDWWVIPIDDGQVTRTNFRKVARSEGLERVFIEAPAPHVWGPDGRVTFSVEALGFSAETDSVWQIAVSAETWQVTGSATRLTRGPGEGQVSLGSGGDIAFSSVTRNVDIWSLPVNTDERRVTGELEQLTSSKAKDFNPTISLEGRLVLFASNRSGNVDIWTKDLTNGHVRALTFTPWTEEQPKVSLDGSKVAYGVWKDELWGSSGWLELRTIREEVARRVGDGPGGPSSLSSDGGLMTRYTVNDGHIAGGVVNIASGKMIATLEHPDYPLHQTNFSPDDRWIVFHVLPTPEHTQVFVTPFREEIENSPTQWIPVTDGQALDDKPRWSPDNNTIYLLSDRDGFTCLWAQPLDPQTKHPKGPALAVKHFHQTQRSLGGMQVHWREIGVARDKIVMPLAERSGNIWLMEPVESGAGDQP